METSIEEPKATLAYTTLVLTAIPLVLVALSRILSPKFDGREPPPLWPTIPLIGHIISLLREQASFYTRLFKENASPICSLPMLNGKIYIINSPAIVSNAMKNSDLSFDPFIIELTARPLGFTSSHLDIWKDEKKAQRLLDATHNGLKGPSLSKLNVNALNILIEPLSAIKPGHELEVPDLWIWLRDTMGRGITGGLFGEKNPITPETFAQLWDFEKGLIFLSQGLDFAAPMAKAARRNIYAALADFYANRHDQHESCADLMRARAVINRELGLTPLEQAAFEFSIMWVGSTNTIPTLLWCFVNVFSRPELVSRIRDEVESHASIEASPDGNRVATMDASRLERNCPILGAAYRETLRVYVHTLGMRRVLRDTTLRDPASGRDYLLRAGVDVHWQTAVTHGLPDVWGPGADDFDPARFLDVPVHEERRRRGAMVPFGGGRHLCPGRNFALAENLGLLAVLALGYEVEGVQVPGSADPCPGVGTRLPVWGDKAKGMRVRRRDGWGDVSWRFTS